MSDCITTCWENANLFRQAQAGDEASIAYLMSQHEGLVHYIVHRQWRGPLSYAEAVHEGRMGLWRAILGFDPDRGVAFSTYASVAIARHVWRAVAQAQRDGQDTDALPVHTVSFDPLVQVLVREVESVLRVMVAHLPVKQGWIVSAYYGLDDQGGCTLKQLGQQLGCTRQAVHYHLRQALLRLRHPAFSALLRALLGLNRRADYRRALRPERRQS